MPKKRYLCIRNQRGNGTPSCRTTSYVAMITTIENAMRAIRAARLAGQQANTSMGTAIEYNYILQSASYGRAIELLQRAIRELDAQRQEADNNAALASQIRKNNQ